MIQSDDIYSFRFKKLIKKNLISYITAKGYITVQVLRDILHELDDKITPGDLDLMIDEIDADGSGTVDFEGIIIHHIKILI